MKTRFLKKVLIVMTALNLLATGVLAEDAVPCGAVAGASDKGGDASVPATVPLPVLSGATSAGTPPAPTTPPVAE